MCQGATQNYAGMLAARFFLGLAEAGFYPGVLYVSRAAAWWDEHMLICAQVPFEFLVSNGEATSKNCACYIGVWCCYYAED